MPTPLHNRLIAAPDFTTACKIMADWFANTARVHAKECVAARVPFDSAFWPACQQRAVRAAAVYDTYLERARQAAAAQLRREELDEYADALESGDFAQHLDLPDATGGLDGLLSNTKSLTARGEPTAAMRLRMP